MQFVFGIGSDLVRVGQTGGGDMGRSELMCGVNDLSIGVAGSIYLIRHLLQRQHTCTSSTEYFKMGIHSHSFYRQLRPPRPLLLVPTMYR